MKVDLPAPFGPVNPYRLPAENVVVTSSKSVFEPYRIDTPHADHDLFILTESPVVDWGSHCGTVTEQEIKRSGS